jgi:3-oxoacyl-[acyl-carrier protein] reductase
MKLAGKTALVTGGAHGIGRAICLGFAREGAEVAVVDIDVVGARETAEAIEALGRKAIAVQADVSVETQVNEMSENVKNVFGKIDILVANAGRFEKTPIIGTTVEQWDRVINNNLRSVFLCVKTIGNIMAGNKYGRIVCISSTAGMRGRLYQHAYGTAKAGILTLVMSAAAQLGHLGITVNAIAPGIIQTDNPDALAEDDDWYEYRLGRMPIKRVGLPEDIVPAAVLLASDDSGYTTGQTLVIDGGLTTRLDACGEAQ